MHNLHEISTPIINLPPTKEQNLPPKHRPHLQDVRSIRSKFNSEIPQYSVFLEVVFEQ